MALSWIRTLISSESLRLRAPVVTERKTDMATAVDLSAPQLRIEAVLRFIDEHTVERPPRNILFQVSEAVFRRYRGRLLDPVPVTPAEAQRMNDELGVSADPQDYLVSGAEWRCTECGRYLNFYDIYQSGKGQHDSEFFQNFLGGEAFHLQVAREDSVLAVDCTECGTVNELTAPVHYTGTNYGYV